MDGEDIMAVKTAIPEAQRRPHVKMTKPPRDWGVLLSWLVTAFIVAG